MNQFRPSQKSPSYIYNIQKYFRMGQRMEQDKIHICQRALQGLSSNFEVKLRSGYFKLLLKLPSFSLKKKNIIRFIFKMSSFQNSSLL